MTSDELLQDFLSSVLEPTYKPIGEPDEDGSYWVPIFDITSQATIVLEYVLLFGEHLGISDYVEFYTADAGYRSWRATAHLNQLLLTWYVPYHRDPADSDTAHTYYYCSQRRGISPAALGELLDKLLFRRKLRLFAQTIRDTD